MTDLDELRSELDDFAQPEKKKGLSAKEERIIAGFEEIQRFVDEHGRAPQHGEDNDIFERLYAVRLDRIRALEECRDLVTPLDHQGLVAARPSAVVSGVGTNINPQAVLLNERYLIGNRYSPNSKCNQVVFLYRRDYCSIWYVG